MSDYERHEGKVFRMKKPEGLSINDFCLEILKKHGLDGNIGELYTAEECLLDELYDQYCIMDGDVWKIEAKEVEEDDAFIHMAPNPDGSYNFVTRFYTGGTGLSEMVTDGLNDQLNNQ